MHIRLTWVMAVLACCGLVSCAKAPDAGFKTPASLQDIMVSFIDPAADALWASVGSETTQAGLVEKQPRTDEEWRAARAQVLTLLEAANLLLIPGREVVPSSGKVEDAHVAGVLSADKIRAAIAADQAGFVARVKAFRAAGEQALTAVNQKNVPALLDAGGRLEHACEGCHQQFWYPGARRPPTK